VLKNKRQSRWGSLLLLFVEVSLANHGVIRIHRSTVLTLKLRNASSVSCLQHSRDPLTSSALRLDYATVSIALWLTFDLQTDLHIHSFPFRSVHIRSFP
jgi:hypothetical protein